MEFYPNPIILYTLIQRLAQTGQIHRIALFFLELKHTKFGFILHLLFDLSALFLGLLVCLNGGISC